jgi:hypothetical protein
MPLQNSTNDLGLFIKSQNVTIVVRVVTAADCFNALRSKRRSCAQALRQSGRDLFLCFPALRIRCATHAHAESSVPGYLRSSCRTGVLIFKVSRQLETVNEDYVKKNMTYKMFY